MKALLIAAALIVVLLTLGVLLTHVPGVGVGVGLVLLLTGLLWPTKAKCAGLHCANCTDHH